MDYSPLPSQEVLKDNLSYDPLTGALTWIKSKRGRPLGKAGTKKANGYIQLAIDSQLYLAHRIIWRMETGEDPGELQIDHINRDRTDNRWDNLRLADQSLQEINKKSKGYSYNKRDKCYTVRLTLKGERRFSKNVKTEKEAIALVSTVRKKYFKKTG